MRDEDTLGHLAASDASEHGRATLTVVASALRPSWTRESRDGGRSLLVHADGTRLAVEPSASSMDADSDSLAGPRWNVYAHEVDLRVFVHDAATGPARSSSTFYVVLDSEVSRVSSVDLATLLHIGTPLELDVLPEVVELTRSLVGYPTGSVPIHRALS